MSTKRQSGYIAHDPRKHRAIDADTAREVARVKLALSKPDARKVMMARYDRTVPR